MAVLDKNERKDSIIYHLDQIRSVLVECELWDTLLHAHNMEFNYYNKRDEFENATSAINKAAYLLDKAIVDSMALVYYFNNFGILKLWGGDYLGAQQQYNKALSIYETLPQHDNKFKFTASNNLGLLSKRLGDFELARSFYSKAFNLLEVDSVFIKDEDLSHRRIRKATLLFNSAQVEINTKQNKTANKLLRECLATLRPSIENKIETISFIHILHSLANNYLKTNQLDSTQYYLNQTYQHSLSNTQKAERFHLIGKMESTRSNYIAALKELKKAKNVYMAEGSGQSTNVALINQDLALCHQATQQHAATQKHYQLAINALSPTTITLADWETPPAIDSISDKLNLLYILSDKAAYMKETANQDTSQLIATLAHYRIIAALEDALRSNYQSEKAKLFLANRSNAFFEQAISTAFELYQLTNASEYLEAAFFFSEKSKALVLLDEIKSKELTNKSLLPDSLVDRKYKLRSQKQLFRIQLARAKAKQEKDPIEIARLEDALFQATQDEIELKKRIAKEEPIYTALTETELMTIAEVQANLLSNGAVMLSYFEGVEQSFVIEVGQEHVAMDTIDSSVAQHIQTLLKNQKMFEQGYAATAFNLYQKLIPSYAQQHAEKLIIIPDGALAYLSFDMLLTNETSALLPQQMDWLLYKYATQYAYSASTLAIQSKKSAAQANILGVAPVFEGGNDYLPFSLEEMEALSTFENQSLLHQNATFAQFSKQASAFGVLHLSTHATAHDADTQQPSIRFSDQTVGLNSIYGLRLSVQLAILSACETNLGNYQKGEGVMSISRGFAYAGVPSLCTSLWAVNDQSTAQIMQYYYEHLDAGKNKSIALQQAKINYLQNCEPDQAAPYYWAAFVSIGNDYPICLTKVKSSYFLYLFMVISIGIITFLVLGFILKRFLS